MNPSPIAAPTTAAHVVAPAAHAVSPAPHATFPQGVIPGSPVPVTAPVQPLATPAPASWLAAHAGWLTHTIAGIFILSAVALVVLLALQTTKQEGLTGTIGGRVESNYRGRLGGEEQLKRITGVAATAFVITALILSLTGI